MNRDLLAFADRTQLTLYLREIPRLPEWLTQEVDVRYRKNAERRARLRTAYVQAAHALHAEGIDFVLLKGFTHAAAFGLDASLRVQYDLDLLTQPSDLARARSVLGRLGYAPHGSRSLSAEHSLPMVQPSDWVWRKDYYDPSMPIPVELHGSVWSAENDRIRPEDAEQFWNRRRVIEVDGLQIPAFAKVDLLGFAGLHVLRHILRHDARLAHVLELARMLDSCSDDPQFWLRWRELHPPQLRQLETVAFRFAHEWFGCAWPDAVAEEWSRQPERVTRWFSHFAGAPIENLSQPDKSTVWLHLALVEGRWNRIRIFLDRLVPLRVPHEGFIERLRYHAGALAPALASGLRSRRVADSTASQISAWKRRSV